MGNTQRALVGGTGCAAAVVPAWCRVGPSSLRARRSRRARAAAEPAPPSDRTRRAAARGQKEQRRASQSDRTGTPLAESRQPSAARPSARWRQKSHAHRVVHQFFRRSRRLGGGTGPASVPPMGSGLRDPNQTSFLRDRMRQLPWRALFPALVGVALAAACGGSTQNDSGIDAGGTGGAIVGGTGGIGGTHLGGTGGKDAGKGRQVRRAHGRHGRLHRPGLPRRVTPTARQRLRSLRAEHLWRRERVLPVRAVPDPALRPGNLRHGLRAGR